MIPGINPRHAKQMMKKMGMQQEDLEATEVIIRTPDKEIVFSQPSVAKVKMMGQETWQISGDFEERAIDSSPEINEEDVKTVMEQADVSEDAAKEAIDKHSGDLAAAIMELKED